MSTYQYGKMTVIGNAKILRDFVKFLEDDYDDEFIREGIKRGQTRDSVIEHEFLGEDWKSVEWEYNYLFIDIIGLRKEFPTLKFEFNQECHDGQSSNDFRICLYGKSVDYAGGNIFVFGKFYEHINKCERCNSNLEWNSERFILKKVMRKRVAEMKTDIVTLNKEIITIEELKNQCLENNLDEEVKELESTLTKLRATLKKSVEVRILSETVLERMEY